MGGEWQMRIGADGLRAVVILACRMPDGLRRDDEAFG
jgi:hypothetical protein